MGKTSRVILGAAYLVAGFVWLLGSVALLALILLGWLLSVAAPFGTSIGLFSGKRWGALSARVLGSMAVLATLLLAVLDDPWLWVPVLVLTGPLGVGSWLVPTTA